MRYSPDEVQQAAEKVAHLRSDLSQTYVIEQIAKLGNETVYDQSHWAQVCLDRAYAESPLPWEAGYLERRYLALLSRAPS